MKKITFIIGSIGALVILLHISACETSDLSSTYDDGTCDYSDCQTSEPYEGLLHLSLTRNAENPNVPICIFRGKFENNDLIYTDTARVSVFSVFLPTDTYYTATAEYRTGVKKIIAIDGDEIRVSQYTICDSTCWNITEPTLDLRLK
ncbi:MAG: hypothetical protein KKD31_09380 [Bacteroidetes bacterium]|nr:hypothetical protein [Bacteroidota bacterium]